MFKENSTCANHKESKFSFYCFDDKSYLCDECFREHKDHKIEIKSDIVCFIYNIKFNRSGGIAYI